MDDPFTLVTFIILAQEVFVNQPLRRRKAQKHRKNFARKRMLRKGEEETSSFSRFDKLSEGVLFCAFFHALRMVDHGIPGGYYIMFILSCCVSVWGASIVRNGTRHGGVPHGVRGLTLKSGNNEVHMTGLTGCRLPKSKKRGNHKK